MNSCMLDGEGLNTAARTEMGSSHGAAWGSSLGGEGSSLVAHSCLPLTTSDGSLPGSSVHGILQARILE